MYEYKRQVVIGLVLSLVGIAISGVVSFIDPFNTGQPWVSWTTLSVLCLLATCASTIILVNAEDDESEFWLWHGVTCGIYIVVGGFIGSIASTGVAYPYTSVVWGAYAAGIVSFVFSCFANYLAAPSAKQNSIGLRRVA